MRSITEQAGIQLSRSISDSKVSTGRTFDPAAVTASPSRLTDADLAALADIVGPGDVSVDDAQRLPRARGKSTPDLLAWRTRPAVDCPDAVVAPGDDDEVAALLDWCTTEKVAVVPFGGGTSVVGGLDPDTGTNRAVLSVDLAHFDGLESIDPESGEAVLGAGVTGPRAEELLGEHGFSLGHFPQSFPYATLGGYAMTRSSGQSSAGYGRFDEMVRGLTVVTPVGVIEAGRAPASAAGPDLRQWLLGSEGAFGVCTRVRVRIHPVPEVVRHEAFRFPDFATGAAALRAAVTEALTTSLEASGTPALVMCHISHVYPTGASLYFTVVAGQRGPDPVAQWLDAKRAASEAIVAAGGTITHHHAVGVDHRPYLESEIGEVGLRMLRAVKNAVDPHGVCNPGTLIP